ncbi:GIY-YIG nuclease family protein [Sphingomonas sp. CCH5-D11]|uniref:GIY-YIG nuclease family protein n=1 Tax=Sphingomonas sp. CCH5-D11 TaxID=1768786 RepID=UPI000829BF43|nr:GIY-YIG nuclease family protein [Sphingomonas sp. CCH5-D11]
MANKRASADHILSTRIVPEDVRESFASLFAPPLPLPLINAARRIEWKLAPCHHAVTFSGVRSGDLIPVYHGNGVLSFVYDLAGGRTYKAVGSAPEQEDDCTICYFIGGDDGPVKIGFSAKPESRLRDLQVGSPYPLKVLATIGSGARMEALYHREFASSRLHGEWFERTPALLAEITRLNTIAGEVA